MAAEIKFLQASEVDAALDSLILEHDEFHWAVAWGSLTATAKKAIKQKDKFSDVTFGIAFCQTDPD